jgi:hypothetical protein
MATNLGTAFVTVKPDWSEFDNLVDRHLRDQFRDGGEQSGRDFSKGFDKHTSGLMVPVQAALADVAKSTDKATSSAKNTNRELVKLGRDGSAAMNATSKAANVAADAVGGIKEEIASAAVLPDLSPTARFDLKIGGAEVEIERLRAHLATLTAKPQSVQVRADVVKAVIDLERVEARLDRLKKARAEIKVDVDQSLPGLFSRITTGAQGLFTALGGSGGGLGGATARVGAGFLSFGASLGPLIALAAVFAVTIGVSLVGALAALAASLAAAAAGVAALAAAVVGVLGPAVALAVAVAVRLAAVFKALKASDAVADEAGRGAASSARAAAAAADQQAAAARGLTEANRQLGLATAQAYREMEDAAEAASDAIRQVAAAQLGVDDARLSTREARNELALFRKEIGATGDAFGEVFQKFTDVSVDTSGLRKAITDAQAASGGDPLDTSQELKLERLILNIREARQREKEAIDGVSDAERARGRAQVTATAFARDGIRASEGYQSALRGVQAATLAVAAAQRNSADSATTAQEKAIQLVDKLSARERVLLATIQRVRKELRGAFQGATDAVLGGMNRALGRLPDLLNPLRGAFTRLGQAWGDAIDSFSRDLVRPEMVKTLREFVDASAELVGPITDGLSSLLTIFLNIAKSALPFLVKGTRQVADMLKRWASATGDTKALNHVIEVLVSNLKTWLGVGTAIADVVLAFFQSAVGPGQALADNIKAIAERTAVWLRSSEGQEKVKQFFHDVIPTAKNFVASVTELVKTFVDFGQAMAPVVGLVLKLLTLILRMPSVFSAFKAATGGVGASLSAIGSGLKALPGLLASGLAAALVRAVGSVGPFLDRMRGRGRALTRSLRDGITSTASLIATAVVGAVNGALRALAGIIERVRNAGRGIGHGIVDGIRNGLGALSGLARTVLNGIAGILNSAIRLINKATPGKIKLPGLPDIPGIPDIPEIKFGRGGMVPGFGTGDTVPAWLTPMEWVNRADVVKRFGPTVFADIDSGRLDPRVGYRDGERPSIGTAPVTGPRFATGGLAGTLAPAVGARNVYVTAPITVAGGGPGFDPVDAGVKLARVAERHGGDPRQSP